MAEHRRILAALVAALLFSFSAPLPSAALDPADPRPVDRRLADELAGSPRGSSLPGERCAVCGTPLEPGNPVIVRRGYRFPLMREMEADFIADPLPYLERVQPRGALFDEPAIPRRASWGWTFFGFVAIGVIVLLGALSSRALRGKLADGAYKVESTARPVRCDGCGASLHPGASRCPRCGAERTGRIGDTGHVEPEVRRASGNRSSARNTGGQ